MTLQEESVEVSESERERAEIFREAVEAFERLDDSAAAEEPKNVAFLDRHAAEGPTERDPHGDGTYTAQDERVRGPTAHNVAAELRLVPHLLRQAFGGEAGATALRVLYWVVRWGTVAFVVEGFLILLIGLPIIVAMSVAGGTLPGQTSRRPLLSGSVPTRLGRTSLRPMLLSGSAAPFSPGKHGDGAESFPSTRNALARRAIGGADPGMV